jgi:hypothetical protein
MRVDIDADAAQLHRRRDRQRVSLQAIGGIAVRGLQL